MTRGNVWVVFGARGEGKTFWACRTMEATAPVVFVDPAKDARLRRAALVTPKTEAKDALEVLRRGRSLIWRTTRSQAREVTSAAVALAIATRSGIWVDEAHLVHPKGKEHPALAEAITSARHYHVDVGLITQAPQALSAHALHAGCTVIVFRLPFAGPWLSAYGLPRDLEERWASAPPHSFFMLRGSRLTGPHVLPSEG